MKEQLFHSVQFEILSIEIGWFLIPLETDRGTVLFARFDDFSWFHHREASYGILLLVGFVVAEFEEESGVRVFHVLETRVDVYGLVEHQVRVSDTC